MHQTDNALPGSSFQALGSDERIQQYYQQSLRTKRPAYAEIGVCFLHLLKEYMEAKWS